jgi:hypothetical protein
MARSGRVEGFERLKAKISRLPAAAKKRMSDANHDAARRQVNAARIRIDRGPHEHGHLEETLKVVEGQTETGWYATVGGGEQDYPLSLEGGHKAPDGTHVPPNPFWYPSRRDALARHKREGKAILDATVADIVRD